MVSFIDHGSMVSQHCPLQSSLEIKVEGCKNYSHGHGPRPKLDWVNDTLGHTWNHPDTYASISE